MPVFAFRAVAQGMLTPEKDADHEFSRLEWVDAKLGLPGRIAANLARPRDVTLGLARSQQSRRAAKNVVH